MNTNKKEMHEKQKGNEYKDVFVTKARQASVCLRELIEAWSW